VFLRYYHIARSNRDSALWATWKIEAPRGREASHVGLEDEDAQLARCANIIWADMFVKDSVDPAELSQSRLGRQEEERQGVRRGKEGMMMMTTTN
jgi:hypothetical protein